MKNETDRRVRIAICDDEREIRRQLSDWIAIERPDCQIVECASGEELLQSGKAWDIVFLDIQMNGINGIETADRLRKQQMLTDSSETVLIFVTAIKEYVFDAFDVAAFHYLLKPLSPEKFKEVFAKALAEVERRRSREEKTLLIRTRSCHTTISQKDIYYIESQGRKVEIHTMKEKFTVYATMRDLEEKLQTGFYRCHRGYIVNMAYIREYNTSQIELGNGEIVYVAKDKYPLFVKTYMRYLREGGMTLV